MKHLNALRHVLASYPGFDCPPVTVQTWAAELSPLPDAAVSEACRALCLESEYPPTLAAIHKRASILARPEGLAVAVVADAWTELVRNRETHSRNRYESRPEKQAPYTWTSEAARRAAESVDWKGDWEGENKGTIRAQFDRFYRAIVESQRESDWIHDTRQHVEDVARIAGQRKPELQ